MAERETRTTHVVYAGEDGSSSIRIAEDVIACIAGLAATEVEGVDSMAGGLTNDIIAKLGVKNIRRGVSLTLSEEDVSIALSLNIIYGYNIPAISAQVQDRVKNTVESMTGLHVTDVSVSIAGVNTKLNR